MARDRYSNFVDLKRDKREGADYRIATRDRGSSVLVMAPHGGRIEPYTTDLADMIAGEDLSFYSFVGLQQQENHRDLHVRSELYDEDQALMMVEQADLVFAIHGHRCRHAEFVMMGGRHAQVATRLQRELVKCGFEMQEPEPGLAGLHVNNICNRGRLNRGVQVEISRGLRVRLRQEDALRGSFVEAARRVFLEFEREQRR